MKTIFLINPIAGKQNSAKLLEPLIRQAGEQAGIAPEILVTTHKGHAAEIAAQYAQSGEPVRLFACGGDGTFNELVQQAAGHDNIAIGCVPCGSGNDFIRNFGTREEFMDLAAQIAGPSIKIDAIRTSYGYSAAICAAGLDAKVAYGIPKFRRLPFCGGSMAYTLSIIQTLFSHLGNELEIKIDGEAFSGTYMMMAICNGQMYGGGYMAAPIARLDDGLLDILLVKPIPRLKIPGFLALYKVGAHLSGDGTVEPSLAKYITFRRAERVELRVTGKTPLIVTVDGECAPRMELEAAVEKKCLNIILPAALIERADAEKAK